MKINFLFLFIILYIQNIYGLKPDSVYIVRPENYGLIYKELEVHTQDGYNIKTWFFPAQELITYNKDSLISYFENPRKRQYQLIDDRSKPTIIICNGDAANMSGSLVYVRGLVPNGYNIVTFDWRGFGESGKFPIDPDMLFYTEFLLDYEAVINKVSSIEKVDNKNIGVYGFSTGALFSFAVSHINSDIKCFAGRALMTNPEDFLSFFYDEKPEEKEKVKIPLDFSSLYPINLAPSFTKPVFLIVGESDQRTPVSMSEKIYNELKGEKKIWIVKDAEHGGNRAPEFIDFQLFLNKIISFYDLHLK